VEYDVTFKVRTSKKETLHSYDLYTLNPDLPYKLEEQKFEEDIVSNFTSKFSVSTDSEFRNNLSIETLEDVLTIFPNLTLRNIKDSKLVSVNNLVVEETSFKLGKIFYQDIKKAEVGFNVWTNPSKGKSPLLGEFDIDINVDDLFSNNKNSNDKLSDPVVGAINRLYKTLRDNSLINKDNITKTEYVYQYTGN
jgi:hypothetical protein